MRATFYSYEHKQILTIIRSVEHVINIIVYCIHCTMMNRIGEHVVRYFMFCWLSTCLVHFSDEEPRIQMFIASELEHLKLRYAL